MEGSIKGLFLSADASLLLSIMGDGDYAHGAAALWSMETAERLWWRKDLPPRISASALSADGRWLALQADKDVELWRAPLELTRR